MKDVRGPLDQVDHSDDNSPRYLLKNFVDFVAGVTHKITKKQ